MADRTITNSPALVGFNRTVQSHQPGPNVVPFSWTANGTTSISLSDIVLLACIPFDAIITRLQGVSWIGSAGNATVDVGLSGTGNASLFVSGAAASATGTVAWTIVTGSIPTQVTGSDDIYPRFRYLQAKWVTSATGTATALLSGVVEYTVGRKSIA